MNACLGNLAGKTRAELEALASGETTDDECTASAAATGARNAPPAR